MEIAMTAITEDNFILYLEPPFSELSLPGTHLVKQQQPAQKSGILQAADSGEQAAQSKAITLQHASAPQPDLAEREPLP